MDKLIETDIHTEEDLKNGLIEASVEHLEKEKERLDMQRRFEEFNRSQIEKGHEFLKETILEKIV